MLKLNVKTSNKLEFFIKLVTILSLADPIKKLRPKERLLFAYVLYYNDKYKMLDIEERSRIVFDKKTRIDICEAMGIDQQTFYNNKSQLKIKGLLKDDYLIKNFVSLYHKENYEVIFTFD